MPTQPYVSLTLEAAKVNTSFEREYLKLTTVLAELSAAVKILVILGKLMSNTFSEYTLYISRIEPKEEIEHSTANLKQDRPILPSFWQYLATDRKKFKKTYPSTIYCETDLNWINTRIDGISNQRINNTIRFRRY